MFLGFSLDIAARSLMGLALATLVFSRTESPFLSAFALFGGAFGHAIGATLLLSAADRIPPRLALSALPAIFGLGALVVALPGLPVWVVLAVVLGVGVLGSLGAGIRWGLLTEVLPEDGYLLGRSAMQMTVGAMQIIATAAAAVALQVIAPSTLMIFAAGLFLDCRRLWCASDSAGGRPAPVGGDLRSRRCGSTGCCGRHPASRRSTSRCGCRMAWWSARRRCSCRTPRPMPARCSSPALPGCCSVTRSWADGCRRGGGVRWSRQCG